MTNSAKGTRKVKNDYKRVSAVANTVSILRALAQYARPIGVAALARETGIGISTCFNILRTLTDAGLISLDDVTKNYAIGIGVLEFSVPILGTNQADLIRPEMERLSSTHETLLCLWQFVKGDRIVLIDKVAAPRTVHVEMPMGARLPTFAGAIGRCYAAHLNPSDEELKSAFQQVKWQSPPTFKKYKDDVAEARREGFALDSGELYAGLEIAATLVIDNSGRPRFGISGIAIVKTKAKHEMLALAAGMRDTAEWISEILFGVPRGAIRNSRRFALSEPNRETLRL